MWVQSPGQDDRLEQGMATHSSVLAWKIPWTEEPGGLRPMGLQRAEEAAWRPTDGGFGREGGRRGSLELKGHTNKKRKKPYLSIIISVNTATSGIRKPQ